MTDVELFTFPGSNAGLTAELLLDHVGQPWRERRLRPGLHVASLRARGFSRGTVPAARIDGRRVQGSRQIARAIAERHPDSGLLPLDVGQRDRVLQIERQGERLQVAARRLVYVLAQDDPSVVRPLIDANFGFLPAGLRSGTTRLIVVAAAKGHGADRSRVDHELGRAAAVLEAADALVEEGLLGTDTPTVADFQIAPNLALLALAPRLAAVLRARPCWHIAERLLPSYPLDATADAPAAWAERLAR